MARKRTLSGDERELWEAVARSAKPLRVAPLEIAEPPPAKKPPVTPPATPKPVAAARPSPPPRMPAKPAALDRRTLSRLSRGLIAVDGRLDLHGLTQTAAHQRLHRFLADAQASGARLVLVITGKGRPDDAPLAEERGVLRRAVPEWLRAAEFGQMVAGFEEAGRRHGGAGALFVRLRKKRG